MIIRYIRYWVKRYTFLHKIRKICDQKGFRIVLHRNPMKIEDGNDSERDFAIHTKDSVLSVKLIPTRKRGAILGINYKGIYAIADGTYIPQGHHLQHRHISYRPRIFRKMPPADIFIPESEGKTVRHIFLVHPTCYEYRCFHEDGSGNTVTSGDTFLGWELWCGRDFRKMLKELKN